MLRQRVREGMRAGAIAAAATAGALVGLGIAHGAAMRPLNSIGHVILGSRAYYMEGVNWLVTPAAVATHLLSVVLWGVLLSIASARLRGGTLYAAALAFATLTWFVDYRIVPDRLRPGFESGLSAAEIATVYVVLALSLAWGLDRERQGDRG